MNYIIRIIDTVGEVIFSTKVDEHPSEDYLRQLVTLHGGSYADVSRP